MGVRPASADRSGCVSLLGGEEHTEYWILVVDARTINQSISEGLSTSVPTVYRRFGQSGEQRRGSHRSKRARAPCSPHLDATRPPGYEVPAIALDVADADGL